MEIIQYSTIKFVVRALYCRRLPLPCSCHACCTCVKSCLHLPLLSSTDFAGENLHLHIEAYLPNRSIEQCSGTKPRGTVQECNKYVLHDASPCASFSFFFFPPFPVWFPLLRLLAAVRQMQR